MTIQPSTGRWFIFFSLIFMFVLAMVPLPSHLAIFRPGFVALGLIYWNVALPYRVGIFHAFICGLFLDVHMNYPLGCHGVAMSVLSYICLLINHQFRMFAVWQQSGIVMMMLIPYHLILVWLLQITRNTEPEWAFFIPVLTSAVAWPFVFALLRDGRRRFKVS